MWRLKQFMPKEQTGLEGKSVEVGALKLQVRSVIAQGGFSSVYLAKDAQTGKNYALKHIICNDTESLDLVRKEVAVMKSLRGHPNVVTLHAQAVFDTGRTKECFLVMDHCEKTLVNVLDSRGAGYFDEKQLLLIFRDICNAVYGMHCQSPPIAHRDLKAENVLVGPDGSWKLCDFGSTSINHKRFEKAEEMGLEEDVIRKHTTPAYRAPEMWDLYQREIISEKVDIWALGCLLYRIAYFKSAFDGESKLQILNGNYRLPDSPRYSDAVVQLIKDMLAASPEARPDIMQVWRRVNESLPSDCRKMTPDKAPSAANLLSTHESPESKPATSRGIVVPLRSPPPPPAGERQSVKSASGAVGAFWSTQYAHEAKYDDEATTKNAVQSSPTKNADGTSTAGAGWSARFGNVDDAHLSQKKNGSPQESRPMQDSSSPSAEPNTKTGNLFRRSGVANIAKKAEGDGYARMYEHTEPHVKVPPSSTSTSRASEVSGPSNDGAFNAFVAEFDSVASTNNGVQDDVDKLKQQLKQALAEKSEYLAKYEKLTAICRSQRQEIQELKSALAAANDHGFASSGKEPGPPAAKPPLQAAQSRRTHPENRHIPDQGKDKQNGSIWELQEGLSTGNTKSSQTVDSQAWQAFGGDALGSRFSSQPRAAAGFAAGNDSLGSTNAADGRRRQQHARAASMSGGDTWGFVQESFSASNSHNQQDARIGNSSYAGGTGSTSFRAATASSDSSRSSNRSQPPAGWAGF